MPTLHSTVKLWSFLPPKVSGEIKIVSESFGQVEATAHKFSLFNYN